MRHTELVPVYVKQMPQPLEQGKLYISHEFELAIHLCACGCGIETVMPFDSNDGWVMTETDGLVTFRPSVGNQQFPCKSHYYITDNKVDWL